MTQDTAISATRSDYYRTAMFHFGLHAALTLVLIVVLRADIVPTVPALIVWVLATLPFDIGLIRALKAAERA